MKYGYMENKGTEQRDLTYENLVIAEKVWLNPDWNGNICFNPGINDDLCGKLGPVSISEKTSFRKIS